MMSPSMNNLPFNIDLITSDFVSDYIFGCYPIHNTYSWVDNSNVIDLQSHVLS